MSLTLTESRNNRTYGKYGFTRSGHKVNKSFYDAVQKAAELSGWGPVYWMQGGLSKSVSASANTHVGLNVGDLSVRTRPGGGYKPIAAIKKFVTWLMRCGAVGFIRGFVDRMVKHLHCVGIPADHAHSSTKAQLYNSTYGYKHGGAGLAGNRWARWWGPKRETMITWAQSKYNPRNQAKPVTDIKPGWYVVDPKKGSTTGYWRNGKRRNTRKAGSRLYLAKFVQRPFAGHPGVYGVTKLGTYFSLASLNRSKKQ